MRLWNLAARALPCRPEMNWRALQRLEKPLWVGALAALYLLYPAIAASQDPREAHILATPLDLCIPFSPRWMFIYVAIHPLLLLPCVAIRDLSLFRRTALAYFFSCLVAYAVYIAFPVSALGLRPDVAALPRSFAGWGLALNYQLDAPLNCFPSLHVATVTLAALSTSKVDPWLGGAAGVAALLVAASTLLVKQHYLLDVAGGVGLALSAYRLFLSRRPAAPIGRLAALRGGAVCAVAYVGMLGVSLAVFRGWKP
jgi:membrane-associated phospholipid phosphatase